MKRKSSRLLVSLLLGWLLLGSLVGCGAPATPAGTNAPPTIAAIFQDETGPSPTPAGATPTPAASPAPAADVVVQVDVNRDVWPISPLIYGLSEADAAYAAAVRPTLLSWGGNPSTRYNWRLGNAWNAGSDYLYLNGNYGVPAGVNAADEFVRFAADNQIVARMVVPTLGWVASNDDSATCSFPLPGGGCGDGDGANCANPIQIADPTLANVPSDVDDVIAWLEHLQQEVGSLPQYVALDNEPELWGYTHYDVHPTCTTYQEILDKYLTYASALRAAFPSLLLTGPITCCWYYYWDSAAGPADKAAHGDEDFLPWFLQQVAAHDAANGVRTLDVLDLHYYPEGLYNNEVDEETAAWRLRSTRSLWDPSYVDESWIARPVTLLPRMRSLIETHYPGTLLGLSEWNWGADDTMNGALAIADVLGILGRERADFAAYWRQPPLDSPGFYAFQLYTNYDGAGGRFGDTSAYAQPDDLARVSSFAALDSASGALHLVLLNKLPNQALTVRLDLAGFQAAPAGQQYRYQAGQRGIEAGSVTLAPAGTVLTLPAYSITHLVLPAVQD